MGLFAWSNDRVKRLGLWDFKLGNLAGVCIGLILAKVISGLVDINIWWFIGIGALCLFKVYYALFKKQKVEK